MANLNHKFDVIASTETWNREIGSHKSHPPIIEGYHTYEGITGNTKKGGCGFYIKDSVSYTTRNDLDIKSYNEHHDFECKWIEMVGKREQDNLILIIGVHYRHQFKQDEEYVNYLTKMLKIIKKEKESDYNW